MTVSCLFLLFIGERDPNFVHGFSTFYAILDLHAEFIQYNYSYMLYFANMKCFLYENTCFDVSWDVLFACLLSAISFAIHHVTYTIYNTRSLSADAECCPPHYPVHDFSSSTKQSYPFNISLYILCHLQKQQTFPRTDYNFKEYREHPYANGSSC